MIYIIPLILILAGVIIYDYLRFNKGKIVFLLIICILLIIIAGLRYRLGEDTLYYMSYYNKLTPLNKLEIRDFESSRYAPGFILLLSFFKMITPEFVLFQIFQAFVVNTVFFYFFYKNCRNVFFAVLIYFLFQYILLTFLQLREALAVSIFLLAWPWFKNGQWIKWYIASLFAFSLHLSSTIMFFVPLICLPWIRNFFMFGKRTFIICIGIAIIAYAVHLVFFKYIELISISERMTERAQAYDADRLGGMNLNIKGMISILIQYVVYPVIAMYFIKKSRDVISNHQKFDPLNAFVLLNTYIVIFSIFVSVFMRFTNYFFPFVAILLGDWIFSEFIVNGKKFRMRLAYWMIFFLPMFSLQIYSLTYGKINKNGTLRTYMLYYPYSSYLDKSKDMNRENSIRYIFRK